MDPDVAERLLPLEGGINFRDFGGYATLDGRRVKWRRLYRSGTMGRLSGADHAHLDQLGIRTVIDFRTRAEQEDEPNHWALGSPAHYWRRQHDELFGNVSGMARAGIATIAEAERVMEDGYRVLPFQQSEAYAQMFRRLAEGEVPAVIHCTAGKDRTGGGAALILSALGVPRASIVSDFTMTARAVDLTKLHAGRKPQARHRDFARMDRDVVKVFSQSTANLIEAFLDTLDRECGSVGNYLADLGITPNDLEEVRSHLLEPAGGS